MTLLGLTSAHVPCSAFVLQNLAVFLDAPHDQATKTRISIPPHTSFTTSSPVSVLAVICFIPFIGHIYPPRKDRGWQRSRRTIGAQPSRHILLGPLAVFGYVSSTLPSWMVISPTPLQHISLIVRSRIQNMLQGASNITHFRLLFYYAPFCRFPCPSCISSYHFFHPAVHIFPWISLQPPLHTSSHEDLPPRFLTSMLPFFSLFPTAVLRSLFLFCFALAVVLLSL